MNPTLHPARIDDAEALATLAARTFPQACPAAMPAHDLAHYIAAELSAERFRTHLRDPARSLWVARSGEGLEGYAMLTRGEHPPVALPDEVRRPYLLQRLYLEAGAQGTGLAARLLALALDRTSSEGGDAMWLTTGNFNQRALAFYRRHGFIETGTTVFAVGDDLQTDVVMLRRLDQVGR